MAAIDRALWSDVTVIRTYVLTYVYLENLAIGLFIAKLKVTALERTVESGQLYLHHDIIEKRLGGGDEGVTCPLFGCSTVSEFCTG